jgi:hypothetical protein
MTFSANNRSLVMHAKNKPQCGASLLLVIVGVALLCGLAIVVWLWISPQHVTDGPASPTAPPSVPLPVVKTSIPPAAGRQAMTGISANADIEQRVKRLARISQSKSPDISQFPAADSKNDVWPTEQVKKPGPVAVVAQPQASNHEAHTEQVKVAAAPRSQAQAKVQAPVRQAPAVSSVKVDTLVTAARANLARDRLTTPAGANALEGFRAVLALNPDNADAKRGLNEIVSRYLSLAQRVARASRFEKAESFLQRADQVGVNAKALLAARQQLAETRANR